MKKTLVLFLAFCLMLGGFTVLAAPNVSAESCIVINGYTGTVIYQKNAYKQMPMASTTKIMTALLLLENADLTQTTLVTKEMVAVEGSSMGLAVGDTVSYKALLIGLLLASGNDAANTIAISLSGSIDGFVTKMNEKAVTLGLLDTHFATPSGLDAEDHYSTAYDMARLTEYAMRNSVFCDIVGSKSATVQYGEASQKRTFYNHNKLLNLYEGACGVKTGYTKKSGRCLVSAAKRQDSFLIAVTLNASDDWNDHIRLYDYGFACLQSKSFEQSDEKSIAVVGGAAEELTVSVPPFSLGLSSEEAAKVKASYCLPTFVYAPVQSGEKIGEAVYCLEDKILAKQDIIASQSVQFGVIEEYSFLKNIYEQFKKLWT